MKHQPESHLSRILTNPDLLNDPDNFFQVYRVPVQRFFLALSKDSSKADDLFQDFAVKFLTGAFDCYTPEKGRFRDFLKAALRNQVKRLFGTESKRKERFRNELHDAMVGPFTESTVTNALGAFDHAEGKEIRQLVELELKAEESEGKHIYHSLLTFLLEYQQNKLIEADADSREKSIKVKVPVPEIAQFLSGLCQKFITEDNARKQKSRAVKCYAEKIITEISNRIGSSDNDDIRASAMELELLPYCDKLLAKLKASK